VRDSISHLTIRVHSSQVTISSISRMLFPRPTKYCQSGNGAVRSSDFCFARTKSVGH